MLTSIEGRSFIIYPPGFDLSSTPTSSGGCYLLIIIVGLTSTSISRAYSEESSRLTDARLTTSKMKVAEKAALLSKYAKVKDFINKSRLVLNLNSLTVL